MQLNLSLLGNFHITLNDTAVSQFRSDKERALLALLVLDRERPYRRETLAGLFWGDQPQKLAFNNLRKTLHRLRHTLQDAAQPEPFLLVTAKDVQCNPTANVQVDVWTFTTLLDQSRHHTHRRVESCLVCRDWLQTAVSLYQGNLLDGFALSDCHEFEEWITIRREPLRGQALAALNRLLTHYELVGESEQAVTIARRLLALEPWQESAHRAMMRLLAAAGNRGAALAQYEQCRTTLAVELTVEPEPETNALYESIKAGGVTAVTTYRAINLPTPVTPFIGREQELGLLRQKLLHPATRLLTLVGEGGIGKTRLALAVAADVQHDFPDGVWFVDLAATADEVGDETESRLVLNIAAVLGLPLEGGTPQSLKAQLFSTLKKWGCLLLLDNFETVMAGAKLVSEMLRATSSVVVLAASREPLQVQAEQVVRLAGLPVPSIHEEGETAGTDSILLFQSSANRAAGQFSTVHLPLIAQICRLLDGIPLGIELAAAWTTRLTPAEILAMLQTQADSLASPYRDVPERHRSMEAVFAGSWRLLTLDQQRALAQVSVFRGGFTQTAVAEIITAPPTEVAVLVDKSLLRLHTTGRIDIHDLLRQFANKKLREWGDTDKFQSRHLDYFCHLAAEAHPQLRKAAQHVWLERLEVEHHNFRAALEWAAVSEAVTDGLRLASALSGFWRRRGYWQEGLSWLERFLQQEKCERETAVYAWALVGAAGLAWRLGNYNLAWKRASESLPIWEALGDTSGLGMAIFQQGMVAYAQTNMQEANTLFCKCETLFRQCRDRWGLAQALCYLGSTLMSEGHDELALARLEESRALFIQVEDRWGLTQPLNFLGSLAWRQGEYEATRELYEACLAIRREFNDRGGVASVLNNLGELARFLGDLMQASRLYEEALAIQREIGSKGGIALSLHNLGHVRQQQGTYRQALALFKESLLLFQQQGNQLGMVMCLAGLAGTAELSGVNNQRTAAQIEKAAVLFSAIETFLSSLGVQLDMADRLVYEQRLAQLRASIVANGLDSAWNRGASLPIADVVRLALAL